MTLCEMKFDIMVETSYHIRVNANTNQLNILLIITYANDDRERRAIYLDVRKQMFLFFFKLNFIFNALSFQEQYTSTCSAFLLLSQ